MHKVNIAGRRIGIPGHPSLRIGLGILLVGAGLLGFLPVLGFWMAPLGLAVLAIDIPMVRRGQRRFNVWLGDFLHRRWPDRVHHFGYGRRRNGRR